MGRQILVSVLIICAHTMPIYCQTKTALPDAATATPAPQVFSQEPVFQPYPTSAAGLWARGEYLIWWQKGASVPPLVTTSPVGTPRELAGVLGQPGTEILFGNNRVWDEALSGARFTLGYWCDPCQTFGIEANVFFLEQADFGFRAESADGSRILARPFFNISPAVNAQASQLVSYPGVLTGSVDVSGSSQLWGAEALLRCRLCDNCWDPCLSACGPMWRVDTVGGYRFLSLRENLGIREDLVSIDPQNPFTTPGTRFIVNDGFRTANEFHGGQVGLAAEFRKGRWSALGTAKIALGVNRQSVDITGSTSVSVPGGGSTTINPGGLLAQPTNIGHYHRDVFAVVPELGLAVSYHVNQRLRLTAGYTLLFWEDVVRPGDQIDLTVNSTQIGGNALVGPARPQFNFNDSSYWVQGLSLGLQWDF